MELKPCPFCSTRFPKLVKLALKYYVECESCGARGGYASGIDRLAKTKARELWNRHPQPTEPK